MQCPPWSTGIWTGINLNMETLKVKGVWLPVMMEWMVSENEFAKLADNLTL